jgi:hypothetical protein
MQKISDTINCAEEKGRKVEETIDTSGTCVSNYKSFL